MSARVLRSTAPVSGLRVVPAHRCTGSPDLDDGAADPHLPAEPAVLRMGGGAVELDQHAEPAAVHCRHLRLLGQPVERGLAQQRQRLHVMSAPGSGGPHQTQRPARAG